MVCICDCSFCSTVWIRIQIGKTKGKNIESTFKVQSAVQPNVVSGGTNVERFWSDSGKRNHNLNNINHSIDLVCLCF